MVKTNDVYWFENEFYNRGGPNVVGSSDPQSEYKYYGYAGSAVIQFYNSALSLGFTSSSAIAKQQVKIEIVKPKRKLNEID